MIKKIIIRSCLVCLVLSTCIFFVQGASNDWLKNAFSRSHNPGDGEPYSVNAEAKDLFDTKIDLLKTIEASIKNKEKVSKEANDAYEEYKKGNLDAALSKITGAPEWQTADSVFVRATRFLMQAVVVLAIPMLIFAALKLIFSMGNDEKLKEALKQIGYVAAGILLALLSVMIIYLITSLTRSSLGGI